MDGASSDDSTDPDVGDVPLLRHCLSVGDDDAGGGGPPDVPAAPFPVASTGDDGSNSLPLGLSTLALWLLDESGKRMGGDSSATDAFFQQYGAPYRLTFASGQVVWGYADVDGLVLVPNIVATGTCTLEWGLRADAEGDFAWANDQEPMADFFAYCEDIVLDAGATDDLEASRKLSNLGYDGTLDDQRAAFAADYSASDNDAVEAAHTNGTAVARAAAVAPTRDGPEPPPPSSEK